ncbi:alpha-beta hydrolase superfamily lysophospholipase [Chryseobacterium ginsenosidimutans]|uniref:alpha/beta hydrolase family protein n=1 Tax=Chryseobacterium ginsenosidimutans TaxID=687846 RepID=UPI002785B9C3|nr:alpha/beta hydrolase [Chryseobacterium ginsenosidimutans]MDQ0592550.1 alpha-beta hydrolase superfamily lysophospholipase [Chryseobacterium ginsenosidimutans]
MKTINKLTFFKNSISIKQFCRNFILILFLFNTINQVFAIPPNFTTKNIKFLSEEDSLAGTIFKPDHPTAAVVIIHGSGQEKRMTEFATLLAENGIAVFTYDKRGVGESGGTYAGPEVGTNNVDAQNLNLLSLDASAAVNVLSKNLSNNKIAIGLIGGSQAGWIIPLAAEKNKKVKFMAIFSGALITVKEQLRFQFYTNGNTNFWDTHTEEDARKHTMTDPDKYEFIDTNPTDTLSKLSIPGLWIYGGKDIQVPVNLSIENLNALKSKGKHYEYKLFPALGHNTAFSKDEEPMKDVIKWTKNIKIPKSK